MLIGVHVLAAIHIAHWLSTGRTVSPLEPSEAMEFVKHSVVNAGLIFFGATILSTLVLGRWFCGWACHVVALQDLSRALLLKIGIRPRPLRSRYMALIPFVGAAYMFLWPLIFRIWNGFSLSVQSVEMTRENFWATFTTSLPVALFTFFIAGFVCVYFLGAKGFCTYACPYGAVFNLAERVAPGRIRVNDDCVQCGHCTLRCTSNVDVSREVHDYGMVVDAGCMKCMDCVSVCPEDALYFGLGRPALGAKPRREKRKGSPKKLPFADEMLGLGAASFAYLAWRGWRQEGDFLLSVGIAACFGFFAMLTLGLLRRSDVRLPGLVLKSGGKFRPLGLGIGTVVLGATGAAIPFGIVPELNAWRAILAEKTLAAAKDRWFQPGGAVLSEEEQGAAETLLHSAEVIDRRTSRSTLHNHMRIAWASLMLGRSERFDAAIERSLRMKGVGPAPRHLMAQSQLANGDRGGAIEIYASIVEEYPARSGYVRRLAELEVGAGELEAARATLERGLGANPNAHELVVVRALILADLGRHDDAARELEHAVQVQPEDHSVRDLARNALRGLGRFDALARVLADGVDRPGAPVEWRADLPQALMAANRPDEAAVAARHLRDLAAGDRRLLQVAATILDATGNSGEAAKVRAEMDQAR